MWNITHIFFHLRQNSEQQKVENLNVSGFQSNLQSHNAATFHVILRGIIYIYLLSLYRLRNKSP